jgi:hypothetical protein
MKCGVLIIGSLLWDDHQGLNLNVRKEWRAKRLAVKKRIHVKVPIAYGRKSTKAGAHFTMVLVRGGYQGTLGTAYVVPFKKPDISIKSLINQGRHISKAENVSDSKLVKGNQDKWCVIGVLLNPKLHQTQRGKLLEAWGEKLSEEGLGNQYADFKLREQESILSASGEILLEWVKAVDPAGQNLVDTFDVVIATCPKPTEGSLPTIQNLKNDIISDDRKYFFNNIKNGITTGADIHLLQGQ